MKAAFVEALRALALPDTQITEFPEGVEIIIFPFNEPARKGVVSLINQYVGHFRSIAVDVKHQLDPDKAHWFVKNHLITGQDLTTDQLMAVCTAVGQRIIVPNDEI